MLLGVRVLHRGSLASWPLRRRSRRSKQGTPISPPARRLPLVAEWAAGAFVVEGIGLPQPAFLESGALGRRGALRESLASWLLRRPTRRRKLRGVAISPPAHRLLPVG